MSEELEESGEDNRALQPPLSRPPYPDTWVYQECPNCKRSSKLLWESEFTAKCSDCLTLFENPRPDFFIIVTHGNADPE